jgi:hypothetical protein
VSADCAIVADRNSAASNGEYERDMKELLQ